MFDYLIKDALIIDGSGAKPFHGDVGVHGDKIEGLGRLDGAQAKNIIRADGLAVSPGFIDIHSHHDLYVIDQDPIARFEFFARQGVTTCVVGNCGWTAAPCIPERKQMLLDLIRSMGAPVQNISWNTMEEYFAYLETQSLICNLAQLVGHGAVRIAVMGDENRFCTPEESRQMQDMVRQSLAAGCIGLSSGLMYYPGMYCHTDELIDLAKVLNEFGRPYATHLRGYCTTLENSIDEALTIVEAAGVPLQISHLYAVPYLGKMISNIIYEIINLIEAVNARFPLPPLPNPSLNSGFLRIQAALDKGTDVGIDIVPYTLGNTTATILFPPWANRGGKSKLLAHIRNPDMRKRLEREMTNTVPKWPHWEEGSWSDPYISAIGWKPFRVLSVQSDKNQWTKGRSFPEIAREWKTTEFSALCRLMLEEDGEVAFTFGFPARPWIEKMFNKVLAHPLMSIGADSVLPAQKNGTPPPSAYGCFPRIIGHYSRELGLFPIEEAVRKMTSLPASHYKLDKRGILKKDAYADLVVFDPLEINESFTDDGMPQYAKGISHVFINGQQIVEDGSFHGNLMPGRVLRA
jgi:N-acyl-D-amino-acid deacylase